jgi:hypothetical protein
MGDLDQTVEMDKIKFHLSIMRNVERNIPKTVRKRTYNWKLVMDFMLGNTSKGGRTSCILHCQFLGVDPDGFTFW